MGCPLKKFHDPANVMESAPSSSTGLGNSMFVLPGHLITSELGYLRGHGSYLEEAQTEDGRDATPSLFASVAGTVERLNKLVSVHAVKSRYAGEVGDLVVGRISEVGAKLWKVDIQSTRDAKLGISSVTLPGGVQRVRTYEDQLQMRSVFAEGDLISAEIQNIGGEGAISLHTRSLKYGKLENGQLFHVPAALVPRLSQHYVSLPFGIDMIFGKNGWLWVTRSVPEEWSAQEGGSDEAIPQAEILQVLNLLNYQSRVYICSSLCVHSDHESSIAWPSDLHSALVPTPGSPDRLSALDAFRCLPALLANFLFHFSFSFLIYFPPSPFPLPPAPHVSLSFSLSGVSILIYLSASWPHAASARTSCQHTTRALGAYKNRSVSKCRRGSCSRRTEVCLKFAAGLHVLYDTGIASHLPHFPFLFFLFPSIFATHSLTDCLPSGSAPRPYLRNGRRNHKITRLCFNDPTCPLLSSPLLSSPSLAYRVTPETICAVYLRAEEAGLEPRQMLPADILMALAAGLS
jgi:exosome complex component RRP4